MQNRQQRGANSKTPAATGLQSAVVDVEGKEVDSPGASPNCETTKMVSKCARMEVVWTKK